jgi:hypothetical protein
MARIQLAVSMPHCVSSSPNSTHSGSRRVPRMGTYAVWSATHVAHAPSDAAHHRPGNTSSLFLARRASSGPNPRLRYPICTPPYTADAMLATMPSEAYILNISAFHGSDVFRSGS